MIFLLPRRQLYLELREDMNKFRPNIPAVLLFFLHLRSTIKKENQNKSSTSFKSLTRKQRNSAWCFKRVIEETRTWTKVYPQWSVMIRFVRSISQEIIEAEETDFQNIVNKLSMHLRPHCSTNLKSFPLFLLFNVFILEIIFKHMRQHQLYNFSFASQRDFQGTSHHPPFRRPLFHTNSPSSDKIKFRSTVRRRSLDLKRFTSTFLIVVIKKETAFNQNHERSFEIVGTQFWSIMN